MTEREPLGRGSRKRARNPPRGALVGVDVPAVLAAADASRDPPPAGGVSA